MSKYEIIHSEIILILMKTTGLNVVVSFFKT